MKKKAATAVPNYKKGAKGKEARKELTRVINHRSHMEGNPRLAQELSAEDGGVFGDPIKRSQRKAKRKMRKDMKNAPVFPGPTRKIKRQQKRGAYQMRKQRGR